MLINVYENNDKNGVQQVLLIMAHSCAYLSVMAFL